MLFANILDAVHAALLSLAGSKGTLGQIYAVCQEIGRIHCPASGGWRWMTDEANWMQQVRHVLANSGQFCRCVHDPNLWQASPSYANHVPHAMSSKGDGLGGGAHDCSMVSSRGPHSVPLAGRQIQQQYNQQYGHQHYNVQTAAGQGEQPMWSDGLYQLVNASHADGGFGRSSHGHSPLQHDPLMLLQQQQLQQQEQRQQLRLQQPQAAGSVVKIELGGPLNSGLMTDGIGGGGGRGALREWGDWREHGHDSQQDRLMGYRSSQTAAMLDLRERDHERPAGNADGFYQSFRGTGGGRDFSYPNGSGGGGGGASRPSLDLLELQGKMQDPAFLAGFLECHRLMSAMQQQPGQPRPTLPFNIGALSDQPAVDLRGATQRPVRAAAYPSSGGVHLGTDFSRPQTSCSTLSETGSDRQRRLSTGSEGVVSVEALMAVRTPAERAALAAQINANLNLHSASVDSGGAAAAAVMAAPPPALPPPPPRDDLAAIYAAICAARGEAPPPGRTAAAAVMEDGAAGGLGHAFPGTGLLSSHLSHLSDASHWGGHTPGAAFGDGPAVQAALHRELLGGGGSRHMGRTDVGTGRAGGMGGRLIADLQRASLQRSGAAAAQDDGAAAAPAAAAAASALEDTRGGDTAAAANDGHSAAMTIILERLKAMQRGRGCIPPPDGEDDEGTAQHGRDAGGDAGQDRRRKLSNGGEHSGQSQPLQPEPVPLRRDGTMVSPPSSNHFRSAGIALSEEAPVKSDAVPKLRAHGGALRRSKGGTDASGRGAAVAGGVGQEGDEGLATAAATAAQQSRNRATLAAMLRDKMIADKNDNNLNRHPDDDGIGDGEAKAQDCRAILAAVLQRHMSEMSVASPLLADLSDDLGRLRSSLPAAYQPTMLPPAPAMPPPSAALERLNHTSDRADQRSAQQQHVLGGGEGGPAGGWELPRSWLGSGGGSSGGGIIAALQRQVQLQQQQEAAAAAAAPEEGGDGGGGSGAAFAHTKAVDGPTAVRLVQSGMQQVLRNMRLRGGPDGADGGSGGARRSHPPQANGNTTRNAMDGVIPGALPNHDGGSGGGGGDERPHGLLAALAATATQDSKQDNRQDNKVDSKTAKKPKIADATSSPGLSLLASIAADQLSEEQALHALPAAKRRTCSNERARPDPHHAPAARQPATAAAPPGSPDTTSRCSGDGAGSQPALAGSPACGGGGGPGVRRTPPPAPPVQEETASAADSPPRCGAGAALPHRGSLAALLQATVELPMEPPGAAAPVTDANRRELCVSTLKRHLSDVSDATSTGAGNSHRSSGCQGNPQRHAVTSAGRAASPYRSAALAEGGGTDGTSSAVYRRQGHSTADGAGGTSHRLNHEVPAQDSGQQECKPRQHRRSVRNEREEGAVDSAGADIAGRRGADVAEELGDGSKPVKESVQKRIKLGD